jgi:hypothetical protein
MKRGICMLQQFENFIKIKDGHNVNFRTQPVVGDNVIAVAKSGEVFQTFSVTGTWCVARRESTGQLGYITTLEQYVEPFEPEWLKKAKRLINYGEKYLGTPYVFSSSRSNDNSFDCSDFVKWCYGEELGITLHSDSRSQFANDGVAIGNGYDILRTGDVIFFDTNHDGIVNHVGIYVGAYKILHTYNTTCDIFDKNMVKIKDNCGGVTYSEYKDGTSWRKNTVGVKRILL